MSLLLEALKKAADAKRQQEDERIQRRTGQRLAITDEMLAEAGLEAAPHEDPSPEPLPRVPADDPADYRPPLSHAEAVAGYGEEGVDTQRVARCVFDSKTPFPGERARRLLHYLGAVIVVLGALSMGGYAFYQERDALLVGQLSGVRASLALSGRDTVAPEATDAEAATTTAAAALPAVAPRLPPAPAQPARAGASDVTPAGARATVAQPAPVEPNAAAGAAAPAPQAGGGNAVALAAPAAEPTPAPPASSTTLARAAPRPAKPARARAPAVAANVAPAVNVVRNGRRAQVGTALAGGFEAFQAGRQEEAERLYGEALALDPVNRDALLGLGAVAVRRGDQARAARMYTALLQRYPRDPVALAALAGLPESGDARGRESELKVLLRANPQSAELHFALGRLYSDEQRWAQAQAAFFEAHRHDVANPDYLFNLAVSLDHLGKRGLAGRYYREALSAAERRAASFDRTAARQRLAALAAAGAP